MKLSYFLILTLPFVSCHKYIDPYSPVAPANNTRVIASAFVLEVGDECNFEPTFLNLDTDHSGALSDFFKERPEWPARNLPDSLKAPGQEVELVFQFNKFGDSTSCGTETNDHGLKIISAMPVMKRKIIEVLDIDPKCSGSIIVKGQDYIIGMPIPAQQFSCLNLPDSLKYPGKIFICDTRLAGINEVRNCDSVHHMNQIVISKIRAL